MRVRNVTLAKHRLPGWSDLMNLSEKQNSEQPNQRINCWDYKANFDPVYIWISVDRPNVAFLIERTILYERALQHPIVRRV